jgi:hypothetical protein
MNLTNGFRLFIISEIESAFAVGCHIDMAVIGHVDHNAG